MEVITLPRGGSQKKRRRRRGLGGLGQSSFEGDYIKLVAAVKKLHVRDFGLLDVKTTTGSAVPVTPAQSIADLAEWYRHEALKFFPSSEAKDKLEPCVNALAQNVKEAEFDVGRRVQRLPTETQRTVFDQLKESAFLTPNMILPVSPALAARFWSNLTKCTIELSTLAFKEKTVPNPVDLAIGVTLEQLNPDQTAENVKDGYEKVKQLLLDLSRKLPEAAGRTLREILGAFLKGLGTPLAIVAVGVGGYFVYTKFLKGKIGSGSGGGRPQLPPARARPTRRDRRRNVRQARLDVDRARLRVKEAKAER